MSASFRTSRLVEFHDTDMADIMHFASFFVYMESAEHELLRSLGLSVHSLVEGEAISFPRVHVECDYLAPARCEDMLDIAIRVERIGEKSIAYGFDFTRDGQAIAKGRTVCVCCRLAPGAAPASQPVPADVAEKLRTYAV